MKPPNFPETISSTVLANLVPEQNQTLWRKQVARTIQSHRAMWDATLFLTYLEVHYTHMPNKCYQRIFPLFALLFRGIFKRHIMSVSLLSATRNLKYPHSAQFWFMVKKKSLSRIKQEAENLKTEVLGNKVKEFLKGQCWENRPNEKRLAQQIVNFPDQTAISVKKRNMDSAGGGNSFTTVGHQSATVLAPSQNFWKTKILKAKLWSGEVKLPLRM